MNKKQTIAYYTLCLNEIKIVDWAIDYWKLFADHVYVFDNGSTDGTLEKLQQYPDWITIIHYETKGTDNEEMVRKKMEAFNHAKENGYDWAIISDFDEFMYCDNWEDVLLTAYENNVGVLVNQIYQLESKEFPTYNPNLLLHRDLTVKGMYDMAFGKICVYNTHLVDAIEFLPGAHKMRFRGIGSGEESQEIFMFHAKQIGLDYLLERTQYLGSILGENDRTQGFGFHYYFPKQEIINGFMNNYNRATNDINNI